MKKEITIREVTLESGIPVKPVYTPDDVREINYTEDIGAPGEFPFVRGIHSNMYRVQPWTMRQYAGFGTPCETNKRFKYLIENGQDALNVAFDLPTQNGLDSDDPRAFGEVGRVGMAVDTLKDMEDAFDGIPIDRISTSLTINPIASIMIAMYLVVAEKHNVPLDQVRGTAQNDILKEYIGRGTWIFPVVPSVKLIGDTIEYCARHLPRYNPLSVCGYHIRESGATPAQEMAYALLIAKAYALHSINRGLKPDEFLPRFSFNFDIHGNIFEQVAKFRAGRRLWARITRNELNAKDPRSMMIRMIAGGGGGGLTIEEPENNIVRGAYYALTSALSGTQTMALCSYDEAYTIPSEKAALISLRTMQILSEEMGLCDTVDPLAGSYYVERLTNEMEKKITAHINEVEELGGIVKCVENGHIQRQVSYQAFQHEKEIQAGKFVKVGVNKYRSEKKGSRKVALYKYNPRTVKEQIKRLNKVRKERDKKLVMKNLGILKEKASSSENLMPHILDCVRAYATVGEMTGVFKEVFGEFKEPVKI
ncbi:MAG: methylmalonyl-CoA mutase [Planctomycetes bacterium]|nr:methylmalonyl-CoA mutase [Planctomycetota bacterium]